MSVSLQALQKASLKLDLEFRYLDSHKTLAKSGEHLFFQSTVPLNSQVSARIALDKDFTYQLLQNKINFPEYKVCFNPSVPTHIQQLYPHTLNANLPSIEEIIKGISDNWFPVVAKMNTGRAGLNVYVCKDKLELEIALEKIFDAQSPLMDRLAIIQKYIQISKEYRVILLDGKVELVYLKDNSSATMQDNLSPLHWSGAKCEIIEDRELTEFLNKFLAPVQESTGLKYCGVDVIQSVYGEWYFLEANASPAYNYFVKDNGLDKVVDIYTKILLTLQKTNANSL